MKKSYLTTKEIRKKEQVAADNSVKCKHCGHTILILNKTGRVVCDWCGYLVFRTPKDEFEFRVKEGMKKNGKN